MKQLTNNSVSFHHKQQNIRINDKHASDNVQYLYSCITSPSDKCNHSIRDTHGM